MDMTRARGRRTGAGRAAGTEKLSTDTNASAIPVTPNADTRGESPAAEQEMDAAGREERIRRRAYELYLERGGAPGDEVEDWLRAERETREAAQGRSAERSAADQGRDEASAS
jgi:hypothetical protein